MNRGLTGALIVQTNGIGDWVSDTNLVKSDSRAHGESLGHRVPIVPGEIHAQAKANRNDPQVTWVQDPYLKDGSDPGSPNMVADNSGCQLLVGVENRNPAPGVLLAYTWV